MNAGLSNLTTLKGFVLPEAMAADTDYDTRLNIIGRGVAAEMERVCGRQFARVAGDTFVTTADRSYLIVARYPVETLTKMERRDDLASGWEDINLTAVLNLREASGFLEFGTVIGAHTSNLRVTYTGGYWWEMLEPSDDGYPSTQPTGSAHLPDDIRQAWLLQCSRIFEASRSLTTAGIKDAGTSQPALPGFKLDDSVAAMLAPHRRFSQ